MSTQTPTRPFLEELKRRKVVRVAVLYVLGAVATVSAADAVFPNLGLPSGSVPLVAGLAVVGLPLALALGWAYQVTPEGLERQRDLDRPEGGGSGRAGTATRAAAGRPVPAVPAAHASDGRRSVAVLPFSNLSVDPQHAYFADGMTEDVLAHLGKVKALHVTSRTSVMRYRETTKPVREIAAELGVGAVLEGSIRATADRVRVVAQLIDARTDTHLWADTYDRELQDIFAVQSEVAECVARALEAELTGEEVAEIREPPTDDVAAYTLYLEGMAAWVGGLSEDYERALPLLEGALRIDPDFARAHAGLAMLLTLYPYFTPRLPPGWHRRLKTAVTRALELDPSSAHGWLARGFYLATCEHDWLGAEKALARASELEPEDPNVLTLRAWHAYRLGRFEESEAWLDRPGARAELSMVGGVCRVSMETCRAGYGEMSFDVPLRRIDALIEAEPGYAQLHFYRADTLNLAGRPEEALAAVDTCLRRAPEMPLAHGLRGVVLAMLGRVEEAMQEEEWFRSSMDAESADRFAWGLIPLTMGDVDRALGLMEEGARSRTSISLPWLRLRPGLGELWGHPRFLAIMDAIWPGEQKQVLGEYGWQPPR
ncbi:MAG: tetratricopeptide repeat protein [Gemmatimonadota bacterium]